MTNSVKSIGFVAGVMAASLFSALPAHAEGDFSAGSQAKEFGFQEEEKAKFSGKVVDVLCELGGDCVDNCGNGTRQMAIVREADNKMIFVLKNAQLAFNGPAEDLVRFCNKEVDVDGLLLGDPEIYGAKFYMVQFINDKGAAEAQKATAWTSKWKERNPEVADKKGPWFRHDPRVAKQIEANGRLGLGHAADDEYRAQLNAN